MADRGTRSVNRLSVTDVLAELQNDSDSGDSDLYSSESENESEGTENPENPLISNVDDNTSGVRAKIVFSTSIFRFIHMKKIFPHVISASNLAYRLVQVSFISM